METVVVTGFGPFGNFGVNASWEVAKELKQLNFQERNINLVTEEVPVVYETVTGRVPELWKQYQPKLMVHIGVSAYATEITLETCGHNDGYKRPDESGQLPPNNQARPDGNPRVRTCFDVEEVSLQFNATHGKDVASCVSEDAGRFLCEFIFYSSLCVNAERTIFIHVPDVGQPYTVQQMALAVKEIILLLLDQIRVKCKSDSKVL